MTNVHLEDNKIGDEGAIEIANGTWPKLDRIYLQNNLFADEAVEMLGWSCAGTEAGTPLSKLFYMTIDQYAFRLCELRNKETIIRIGGAITKVDMAGVEDQGRKREKSMHDGIEPLPCL